MAVDPVSIGMAIFSAALSYDSSRKAKKEAERVQKEQVRLMKEYNQDMDMWDKITRGAQDFLEVYHSEESDKIYNHELVKNKLKRDYSTIEKTAALIQTRRGEILDSLGIGDSGIAVDLANQDLHQTAAQRIAARARVPMEVAREQRDWYNLGQNAKQGIADRYRGVTDVNLRREQLLIGQQDKYRDRATQNIVSAYDNVDDALRAREGDRAGKGVGDELLRALQWGTRKVGLTKKPEEDG